VTLSRQEFKLLLKSSNSKCGREATNIAGNFIQAEGETKGGRAMQMQVKFVDLPRKLYQS
jgi:hypothetical protein